VAEAAHFLESKKRVGKMDNQFLDIKNVPKVPKLPPSEKALPNQRGWSKIRLVQNNSQKDPLILRHNQL
jgi:hypothetical protein